jgi:hypothetical protein
MNIPHVDYLANHINPTWIYLTWEALDISDWDKTGGDAPVYYELFWDSGTEGESWVALTTKAASGLNLNFNHTKSRPFNSGSL